MKYKIEAIAYSFLEIKGMVKHLQELGFHSVKCTEVEGE